MQGVFVDLRSSIVFDVGVIQMLSNEHFVDVLLSPSEHADYVHDAVLIHEL
jgi:hypothetical protein